MGDYKQRRLKMGDEEASSGGGSSEDSTSVSSPTGGERVKLFCSHGGKILPRPSDGTLKYVGGETRVVAIPRSITFSELMEKINKLFDGEYILKYQLASEDLDSLVSVKSDEDTRHFLDEYDRLEKEGVSKLRTYLFPLKSVAMETQTPLSVLGPHAIEQRFVDAINGIVRPSTIATTTTGKPLTVAKSISSSPTDCSSPQSLSPRSIAAHNNPAMNQDCCSLVNGLQNRMARFHRVQSSPANLDSQHDLATLYPNGYIPQFSPSPQHQWFHQGYQYPTSIAPPQDNQHFHHGYQARAPRHQSPTSPQDHHVHPSPPQDNQHFHHGYQARAPRHQSPTSPQDHHVHPSPPQHRHSPTRSQGNHVPALAYGPVAGNHNPSYQHPMLRHYPGSGGHRRWGHLEQYATAARADGLPRSPG